MTRMLGVDYGMRRLGFAVSDPLGIIATPLCVVHVRSDEDALAQIQRMCAETGAQKLIIGMPTNMNGTKGEMALRVEQFMARLAPALPVAVESWDERLTTSLVERVLIEADVRRADRKNVRDMLAAQAILQSYLDSRQHAETGSEES